MYDFFTGKLEIDFGQVFAGILLKHILRNNYKEVSFIKLQIQLNKIARLT